MTVGDRPQRRWASPARGRWVALGLSLLAALAWAGNEKQATILTRAFSYDYNLKARAGDSVTLAVLYKSGDAQSEAMADSWYRSFQGLTGVKVQGLPFSVMRLPFDNAALLRAAVAAQGIDILFVCDRLDGELGSIKEVSRSMKLLTVGGRPAYVEDGLSLGVFSEGEAQVIQVNLSAAAQENVSFSSDLLRLAKVIK